MEHSWWNIPCCLSSLTYFFLPQHPPLKPLLYRDSLPLPQDNARLGPILFLAASPSGISEFPLLGVLLVHGELQGPVGWGGMVS